MKIPIISKLFERRYSLADLDRWLDYRLGGAPTATGVPVTEGTAMRSTAVFACVRILAETIASLPLSVYRRLPGGGKGRAQDHYLYPILHDMANPEMTSFELREALMGHLALWGNAYAEIQRDGGGRVITLWPLRPDRMRVTREDKKITYRYQSPKGEEVVLFSNQVLHIRGLSPDGLIGYSPIRMCCEAIGLALATEEFGARFFGNDARPGVVLKHPQKLSDVAYNRLKESWNEQHQGLSNAHRAAILEEGIDIKEIGIPPEDAQFLQTREFQLEEIARIFRVPLHLVGDLKHATFSNIEHQSIEFVVHTIRPWLVRWEQAINARLLGETERRTYFAEHLVDGLLRGDAKARNEALAIQRQNGIINADEWREIENMNPQPDGQGKVYLVPLNMVPADQIGKEPPPEPPPDETNGRREHRAAASRRRIANAYKLVFADAVSRIIRREEADVMRAAGKHLGKRDAVTFDAWLEEFYRDHREFVGRNMLPVYRSYAEAIQAEAADEVGAEPGMTPELEEFIRAYLGVYVTRHVASSQGQIREIVTRSESAGEDPVPALQERFDQWKERRPEKVAKQETIRAGSAIAKAVFLAAGVTRIRWQAWGENCPYCNSLDGRVISIHGNFVLAGEELKPEGVDKPLTFSTNIGHPPAHQGCLAGGSLVLSRDGITGASKRWYDGDVVVIGTSGGHKLTCTPNHPILTSSGWIAAGALNIGGDVICDGSGKRGSVCNGDNEDVPARIEDVAEAFLGSGKAFAMPVPVSAEYFDGDGAGSKIAVIGTDCLLMDGDYSAIEEHVAKSDFVRRDADPPFLSCPRCMTLFGESLSASRGGPVSPGSLGATFRDGHLTGTDKAGLTATSGMDSAFEQVTTYNASSDTKTLGDGIFGFAGQVKGGNSLDGQVDSLGRRNAVGMQASRDNSLSDTQLARDILDGLAGPVLVDQVVNIERTPFHGYVYNLQTPKGFYAAESIITHNCDCSMVAELGARGQPRAGEELRKTLRVLIRQIEDEDHPHDCKCGLCFEEMEG